MQVLTYIHVLFTATTTTKYAILDLLLLNADTDVSTMMGIFPAPPSVSATILREPHKLIYQS